jgi:hypothetical protein
MYSHEVSEALLNGGYVGDNKLDILVLDVCLGASIEDAYQFRDYSRYMVASELEVPGAGNDYVRLIGGITRTTTVESLGKKIVTDFRDIYGNGTDLQLSFVNLRKVEAVKTAVDTLAAMLLPTDPENGSSSYVGVYSAQVRDAVFNIATAPVYKETVYGHSFDLGCAAKQIAAFARTGGSHPWQDLVTAASKVNDALGAAVVYAWIKTAPFSAEGTGAQAPYGLVIYGKFDGEYPSWSWYETDLAFGANPSYWAQLLKFWQ